MNNENILKVMRISEVIAEVARFYHDNIDKINDSDFNGMCEAKAMNIINYINEGGEL